METKQSVVEIFFLIVIMGHHMNYLGVYYKLTNSWSSFQALPAFSGIVFKVISNVNWKHFTWWDLNICFPDWRIYQHAIMWLYQKLHVWFPNSQQAQFSDAEISYGIYSAIILVNLVLGIHESNDLSSTKIQLVLEIEKSAQNVVNLHQYRQ